MTSHPPLRAVRVYHSGVVSAWRQRDRELRALGAAITLIAPRRWNEGGRDVELAPGDDAFVRGVRTFGSHPYRFVFEPIALWRGLRRAGSIDVLDIHEEPASLAAFEVWVLARFAGRRVPFCLYSAQNIAKRYPPPFRWIEQLLLRRAAAVHTCNDVVGEVLRGKGFSGAIENLGLGVDVERFAPDPDRPPAPALHVGYVGRLEDHKGVDVLIDALGQVPEATATIVGDGPARDRLAAQIDEAGLSGRVTMTGFAAHDELPAVYRSFTLLAVPSLDTPGWIEQFGRVAVEAMACGVAVVASDSGSLPEVVGEAGALVPPGDATALAGAIRTLGAQDGTERSARARARALHWSWPRIAARQLALYDRMRLDAPPPRTAGEASTGPAGPTGDPPSTIR